MPSIFLFSLLAGLCLSPTSNASPATARDNDHLPQPIVPSKDPWYTAPHGYEEASPGSILRIRPAPGNLTAVIGSNCSAAYNILYRTTNSYLQPAFAVTTVFIPNMNIAKINYTTPLLSYQIPYSTADLDASPSYTLSAGGYPDIPVALGQGWIVNVPDFEGPLASLSLSITEGLAVVDSIRSVLSYQPFHLSPKTTRTALWGYSGGSIATTFALEFQPTYAPELTLHGAALGGLLTSFISANPALDGTGFAGNLPAIYLGLTSQSSSARQFLLSSLHPNNASEFLAAENMSYYQDLTYYQNQNISSYFINLTAFLLHPEIHQLTKNNWEIGWHGIPQVPLFVYKAIHDELVYVQYTDAMVDRWCEVGLDVRYERNTVGGHLAEYYNGVDRSRQFLTWVLQGTTEGEVVPYASGCSIANVTYGSDTSPI
ncbi:secretory lipase-domain-containing protein [Talaromyces proteolyticus]|uniref:Secretory lipase-domain-containing protein n=1 Tax=Talaromyces proteolyticus TaxID=1131652 RepID=A0AAD4KIZ9_9EURO|nr:secretory lipase-domain-containing protein [Talaromyces proteolyticus]KAH8689600.1 secretory lipase-domain-containing protein [Talaromyces proteolyticus]